MTTGSFIAFMAAFGQFLAAMALMGGVLAQVLLIVPLYNRARPIVETSPETAAGQNRPGELRGEIEVNSLSFRYDEDGPRDPEERLAESRRRRIVAVVGPSGVRKSTLFRCCSDSRSRVQGRLLRW